MTDTNNRTVDLIGIYRATFDNATFYRRFSRTIEWMLPTATIFGVVASRYWSDPSISNCILIVTSVVNLVLTIVCFCLWSKQENLRRYAETVRRVALLCDGYGYSLPDHHYRKIRSTFKGGYKEINAKSEQNYFASNFSPGDDRMLECISESAFWSADIYDHSKKQVHWRLMLAAIASIISLFLLLPYLPADLLVNVTRCGIILTSAFFTWEVFRAWIGFASAKQKCDLISERIEGLRMQSEKRIELMHILGDYNAIVELAPLPETGAYDNRKDRLTEAWEASQSNT